MDINPPTPIQSLLTSLQSGHPQPHPNPNPNPNPNPLSSPLKQTLGNLLIRGYRILKHNPQKQCIILLKKQQFSTTYYFLKMCMSREEEIGEKFFRDLEDCVREIQGWRDRELEEFLVGVLFGEFQVVEVRGSKLVRGVLGELVKVDNKTQLLQCLPPQSYTQQSMIPPQTPQQPVLPTSPQLLQKLKSILHNYIDTFGQKSKTTHYKQLSKKSTYLINTLNLLIFQQTRPTLQAGLQTPALNQIQCASWTAFKTGKLESDRKDVVLTGGGRIVVLDLWLGDGDGRKGSIGGVMVIEKEYVEEVQELLLECTHGYDKGVVKVVKIQSTLTSSHTYNYHVKQINSFDRTLKP